MHNAIFIFWICQEININNLRNNTIHKNSLNTTKFKSIATSQVPVGSQTGAENYREHATRTDWRSSVPNIHIIGADLEVYSRYATGQMLTPSAFYTGDSGSNCCEPSGICFLQRRHSWYLFFSLSISANFRNGKIGRLLGDYLAAHSILYTPFLDSFLQETPLWNSV